MLNLQVIAEAMAGFDASSSDPLLNKKIEIFDFGKLVDRFDAARAANPTLTSWAASDGLPGAGLAASDTAALGGDLTYQYGLTGTLAGIGVMAARNALTSSQFGTQTQGLQPLSVLQDGAMRLA